MYKSSVLDMSKFDKKLGTNFLSKSKYKDKNLIDREDIHGNISSWTDRMTNAGVKSKF
jgi:hypothetical protein